MEFVRGALALMALGTASLQAAADPALLGLMMPDATSIGGVQVEQSRNSPLGQFLLARISPASPFDAVKDRTGFDPRTDLTEIVAASAGPAQMLLAGRGVFQQSRILALAQTEGATLSTYRGMTLIGMGPPPAPAAFSIAFLDASTVVAGTTPAVQGAIDRWFVPAPYAGPLATKVAQVSSPSQAWSVATGLSELLTAIPSGPPQVEAIRNLVATITTVSGGVAFGDTGVQVTGKLETRSAQDAQSMADVLRLLASMAPQPGLAGAATFSNAGSVVTIQISLTQQQVEQLLKPPAAPAVVAAR